MARAKKEYKNLTIKLDKTVADRLEQYCEEVGQTKTTAIERILSMHFDKREKKQNNEIPL